MTRAVHRVGNLLLHTVAHHKATAYSPRNTWGRKKGLLYALERCTSSRGGEMEQSFFPDGHQFHICGGTCRPLLLRYTFCFFQKTYTLKYDTWDAVVAVKWNTVFSPTNAHDYYVRSQHTSVVDMYEHMDISFTYAVEPVGKYSRHAHTLDSSSFILR